MRKTRTFGIRVFWLLIIAALSSPTIASLAHVEAPMDTTDVLDFSIQLINGTELYMGDLSGDTILVDLMATYCLNCLLQIDILKGISTTYRDITIVTISVTLADSLEILSDYTLDYKILWLVGLDIHQQAINLFNVTIIPTVVLIGPQGMIHYYNKGVVLEPQLEEWVDSVDNTSSQHKYNQIVYSTTEGFEFTSDSTITKTTPSITALLTLTFLGLFIIVRKKKDN
ncbi:MAG: TlpA family protein disulfide reductase [Candidatus Hodarchaeota archaeon]